MHLFRQTDRHPLESFPLFKDQVSLPVSLIQLFSSFPVLIAMQQERPHTRLVSQHIVLQLRQEEGKTKLLALFYPSPYIIFFPH
jgi:hypothetical protein